MLSKHIVFISECYSLIEKIVGRPVEHIETPLHNHVFKCGTFQGGPRRDIHKAFVSLLQVLRKACHLNPEVASQITEKLTELGDNRQVLDKQ